MVYASVFLNPAFACAVEGAGGTVGYVGDANRLGEDGWMHLARETVMIGK